ncbi:unnamed protein product [Choristocarpus tenellus]
MRGLGVKKSTVAMSLPEQDPVRQVSALWELANNLSVKGRWHEAVLEYLRARSLLKGLAVELGTSQSHGSQQTNAEKSKHKSNGRGAAWVVNELMKKVNEELECHLSFLEGNHYAALRIAPGKACTIKAVRKSYFDLVLHFHPDKTLGLDSGPLFNVIQAAYEVLSDPKAQDTYRPTPSSKYSAFRWPFRPQHQASWREQGQPADKGVESHNSDQMSQTQTQSKEEAKGQGLKRGQGGRGCQPVEEGKCLSQESCGNSRTRDLPVPCQQICSLQRGAQGDERPISTIETGEQKSEDEGHTCFRDLAGLKVQGGLQSANIAEGDMPSTTISLLQEHDSEDVEGDGGGGFEAPSPWKNTGGSIRVHGEGGGGGEASMATTPPLSAPPPMPPPPQRARLRVVTTARLREMERKLGVRRSQSCKTVMATTLRDAYLLHTDSDYCISSVATAGSPANPSVSISADDEGSGYCLSMSSLSVFTGTGSQGPAIHESVYSGAGLFGGTQIRVGDGHSHVKFWSNFNSTAPPAIKSGQERNAPGHAEQSRGQRGVEKHRDKEEEKSEREAGKGKYPDQANGTRISLQEGLRGDARAVKSKTELASFQQRKANSMGRRRCGTLRNVQASVKQCTRSMSPSSTRADLGEDGTSVGEEDDANGLSPANLYRRSNCGAASSLPRDDIVIDGEVNVGRGALKGTIGSGAPCAVGVSQGFPQLSTSSSRDTRAGSVETGHANQWWPHTPITYNGSSKTHTFGGTDKNVIAMDFGEGCVWRLKSQDRGCHQSTMLIGNQGSMSSLRAVVDIWGTDTIKNETLESPTPTASIPMPTSQLQNLDPLPTAHLPSPAAVPGHNPMHTFDHHHSTKKRTTHAVAPTPTYTAPKPPSMHVMTTIPHAPQSLLLQPCPIATSDDSSSYTRKEWRWPKESHSVPTELRRVYSSEPLQQRRWYRGLVGSEYLCNGCACGSRSCVGVQTNEMSSDCMPGSGWHSDACINDGTSDYSQWEREGGLNGHIAPEKVGLTAMGEVRTWKWGCGQATTVTPAASLGHMMEGEENVSNLCQLPSKGGNCGGEGGEVRECPSVCAARRSHYGTWGGSSLTPTFLEGGDCGVTKTRAASAEWSDSSSLTPLWLKWERGNVMAGRVAGSPSAVSRRDAPEMAVKGGRGGWFWGSARA